MKSIYEEISTREARIIRNLKSMRLKFIELNILTLTAFSFIVTQYPINKFYFAIDIFIFMFGIGVFIKGLQQTKLEYLHKALHEKEGTKSVLLMLRWSKNDLDSKDHLGILIYFVAVIFFQFSLLSSI